MSQSLELAKVFQPLTKPARYKGAWGGRGSGKSHFFATWAVLQAYHTPGFRIVCVREVQRSIADSVKRLLEDKIAELGLGEFFASTEAEIRGLNGSLVIFRGLQNHTAASIKSLEGFHVAWVEEAQTISQKSLDLLTPTIRAPGSELWFSWNPASESDPIDQLLRANPPDEAIVIHANYSDNPWFPDELRTDMERDRKRDPDKYFHVWEGQYQSRSEARIFKNVQQGERNPPADVVWFYGADFGFGVDPSAGVRCCVLGDELYIDHEAYGHHVPTERLPSLFAEVEGMERWPSRGDSSRPETIDYLRRHGFPKMRGAKKGKGSVEDGILFLQGFDIVVHPRCANLWNEFSNYAYKTDKQTGEILPVVEDAHNHAIDALRYAVERLHRKGKRIPGPVRNIEDRLERPTDYQSGGYESNADSWKVA